MGLYVLYWEPHDRLPLYIGMAKKSIAARICRGHLARFENREIRMTFFNGLDLIDEHATKRAEERLLSVFNPPANEYIDVRHPDEVL